MKKMYSFILLMLSSVCIMGMAPARNSTIPVAFDSNTGEWNVLLALQYDSQAKQWFWNDFTSGIPVSSKANSAKRTRLSGGDVIFQEVKYESAQELNKENNRKNQKNRKLKQPLTPFKEFVWIPASELLTKKDVKKGYDNPNTPVHRKLKKFFAAKWPGVEQQLAGASQSAVSSTSSTSSTSSLQSTSSQWCNPTSQWSVQKHPNRPMLYFYENFNPYYEFTNFYEPAGGITIDGKKWPTTEHYFQAMKFTDPVLQEQVRRLATPRAAFQFTRQPQNLAKIRGDWATVKLDLMRKAVLAKFSQNPMLRQLLLGTGNAVLVEDAGPNDAFYGAGNDCNGANWLGLILMETRKKLGGSGY